MRDPNRLCPGCMNDWDREQEPCPVCGFIQNRYERPARWLPLKHILNGKYMVGKVIGEGGFGITYIGWDLNLEVRVAIKEYFPVSLATREGAGTGSCFVSSLPGERREQYRQGLEKFMAEARNLSRFYKLEGIVSVRDFFFENETAYMVMEYVDGVTLGTFLKQRGGCLPEEEVLRLFHPVLESLREVHKSGIIHRDISPDNIMITKDGRMKLIDFGAARFAGQDGERSLTIILKHGYAPAEQYQSHGRQGPWTDVYAACATMYRMLTGQVPPGAMDRLHEDTLQDFDALGLSVSDQTAAALIDHGMAIRESERYRDMQELMDGLYLEPAGEIVRIRKKPAHEDMEAFEEINRQKTGSRRKQAALAAGLVIGLAAVAGLVAVTLLPGRRILPQDTAGTVGGESAEQAAGSDPEKTAAEDFPAEVDAETLAALQSRAREIAGGFCAGTNSLVFLREDGTAAGSGFNAFGNLDVGKWTGLRGISAGGSHTLGLTSDGTAVAAGDTGRGKCAVELWKDLTAVAAGEEHSLGLKADGTVVSAGSDDEGQCDVFEWSGITAVAAGRSHSLGLLPDGTAVAAGDNKAGQCQVSGWTELVQICACGDTSAGLTSDGSVLLAGDVSGLEEAKAWKQVTFLALGDGYLAGLFTDGSVRVAADRTSSCMVLAREDVSGWTGLTCLAAAGSTLFGRQEDGTILRTVRTFGTVSSKEELKDLSKAVAGAGFLLGLKTDGTVVSWGVSGTDPGLAETADWTGIQDMAANADGVLALTADGRVKCVGDAYKEAADWSNIISIAMADGVAAGIKNDGTVVTAGPKKEAYSVTGWTNVSSLAGGPGEILSAVRSDGTMYDTAGMTGEAMQIRQAAAGEAHIAAVREDGTVLQLENSPGNYGNVSAWKQVRQVAAGVKHTAGRMEDGTVKATGSNLNGQCETGDWSGVISVSAGDYCTLGVRADGTLLMAGSIPGEY